MTMRDKAECIMRESIQRVMPGPAVTTALQNCKFSEGRLYLVAVGKAAWEMANSAVQCLDKKVCAGIVLTKYGHVQGSIKDVVCYEAGHPVPDENALRGTQAILRMVTGLEERDTVLFLLSGGGYAKDVCTTLGYDVTILTDRLTCEAREAGMFLGSIALAHANTSEHLAFLAGGETVVHLMGKGLGGRNQEIALAAASQIEGIQNVAVFSFGSDGTDGPTDAAGGYVDGKTSRLVDIDAALKASDSYHALQKSGGLLVTGPTGTNVNDLAVVLIN